MQFVHKIVSCISFPVDHGSSGYVIQGSGGNHNVASDCPVAGPEGRFMEGDMVATYPRALAA